MAENSKIEWCDHTANLWWGCTKILEGCDHCYAETLSRRWDNDIWGDDKPRKMIKSSWNDLNKFQKNAEKAGVIHRVFMGSMMDIFEKSKPLLNPYRHFTETDDLRQELFTQMTWDGGLFNNLLLLFLTKRPSNIPKIVPAGWLDDPLKNVMYGTSVSTQKNFDTLVPQLLKVNGYRFISMEPQIEPINIVPLLLNNDQNIHWIIQGGESGHHKRPFDTDWARYTRDQCKDLGIPYFFKQVDKIQPIPSDLQIREFPN